MSLRILNSPSSGNNAAAYVEQARPDAGDIDTLVAGISGQGVVSGCQVADSGATPTMGVVVSAGTLFSGAAVAGGGLSLATASSTDDRIDLIVADNVSGATSVVEGTASSTPAWPTVPASSVVLAAVVVPANATAVTDSNITDKRVIINTTLGTFSSPPSSPAMGQLYYDTTKQQTGLYMAGKWVYSSRLRVVGGAPIATDGAPGDYYLDNTSGIVYGPKAAGSPTFVAATSGGASVTVPTAASAGQTAFLACSQIGSAPTLPAGWTQLGAGTAPNSGYYLIAYKVLAAADIGATLTPNGGQYHAASLAVYASYGTPTEAVTPTFSAAGATESASVTGTSAATGLNLAVVLGVDANVVADSLTVSAGTLRGYTTENATVAAFCELATSGTAATTTATVSSAGGSVSVGVALITGSVTTAVWPVAYNPEVNVNAAQATLTGTSAGSAVSSQPFTGSAYKKVLVWLDGYENTTATAQTITFPTPFTQTPLLAHDDSGSVGATPIPGASVTTTALTLPTSMTSAVTGWIIVEGY